LTPLQENRKSEKAMFNRPYARKIKLAEFSIKKSGTKSYLENPKGKPGNPGVQEISWVFTQNMTHQQQRMERFDCCGRVGSSFSYGTQVLYCVVCP
jgi:hypothetical protein